MVNIQRIFTLFVGAIFISTVFGSWSFKEGIEKLGTPNNYNFKDISFADSADSAASKDHILSLYEEMNLQERGLDTDVFSMALKGFELLNNNGDLNNNSIVTIIDFDQPSYNKRMYIVDLESHQLLYQTYTSHGRNSGKDYATSFSNTPSSNKSSLGFYVTSSTYYGANGYSLKLIGKEKNINDNALARAIVIHGADYVSENNIDNMGYLGRSFGCPALVPKLTRPIIDLIKNGSCLFIYNSQYKNKNNLLAKN